MSGAEVVARGGESSNWVPAIAAVAEDIGLHVDLGRMREAFDAASSVRSRNPLERLILAAEPLGMRVAPCVTSAATLCSDEGLRAALVWDGRSGWLALRGTQGRRARVRNGSGAEVLYTAEELAETAGVASPDHPLVVGMFEPSLPLEAIAQPHDGHGAHHDHEVGVRALRRVVALMRLERADVATCVIYAIFIGLSTLIVPIAVQSVVNTVGFTTLAQPLLLLSLVVLGALSFSALLRALQEWVVERLQRRLFVRATLDFATRLPNARLESLEGMSTWDRALRFFDLLTTQKTAATLLTEGTSLVLQAAAGLLLLAFYHPFLLIFDIVLMVVLTIVVFGLGRGAIASSVDESNRKYETASWIVDIARNLEAFRMHPQAAVERAGELAGAYVVARRANFRIVFRQLVASLAVQALGSAALLAVGGWLVLGGQLSIGQLVAAEIVVASIVGNFTKLSKQLDNIYELATSLEKQAYVVDLPLERRAAVDHLERGGPARLEIRNVGFDYGAARPVFDGLDLRVEPGDRVALVGPHGSGKSSFADLVTRLRDPSRGTIRIDDIDVRELDPVDLRTHVVVVRGADVFDATVFDNVSLGRPDVTARQVRRALEQVGLGPTIDSLPAGIATRLLSGGRPLSFGEAQRLALARALVGAPRLLVVDGLLDGLDPHAAEELARCLVSLEQKASVIVLTTDPDVARFCDRTVRIEAGIRGMRSGPSEEVPPESRRGGAS